ncbi:MAG: hypothetical protein ACFFD3_02720 [Candidatus Thorarchaeota archaeon]
MPLLKPMTLFSEHETARIKDFVKKTKTNVLITFRQKHGPTELKRQWAELLAELGHSEACISWWSGAGSIGLLECELPRRPNIYGQWALHESNILLGLFEVADEEITDIRSGYDAQSVTDPAMRAIRIGESGGELE